MNPPQFARPSYLQALILLGWLILCYIAAAIGAVASVNAPAFYGELVQPYWAPPAWLFFAWRLGGWAFAEVLLLWALIAATIWAFWRFSRVAAILLVAYLGWVSFAAALNFWLWRANPGLLG